MLLYIQWDALNAEWSGNLISLALIKGFTVHFIVHVCLDKMVTKHNLQPLRYHSSKFDPHKRTMSCVS